MVGSVGQKDASADLRADGWVAKLFVVDALAERHIGETPGPHPVDLVDGHAKVGRLKAGGFHGIDDPLEDGGLAAAATTERGVEIKSLADGRALGHGGALAQNRGGRDRGDVGVGRDRRVGGKRLWRDENFSLYVVVAAQHVILSPFIADIGGACWLAHLGAKKMKGQRRSATARPQKSIDGAAVRLYCCRVAVRIRPFYFSRGQRPAMVRRRRPTRWSLPYLLLLVGGPFVVRVFSFFPQSSSPTTQRPTSHLKLDMSSTADDQTERASANKATTSRRKKPKQSPPKQRECACSVCGASFASRNALFQHLKTTESCASKAGFDVVKGQQLQTYRVALLASYDSSNATVTAEEFGGYIRSAFDHGLAAKYSDISAGSSSTTSLSQTTVTKLRHVSLGQEAGCSAIGDVLILGYNAPAFEPYLSVQNKESLRRQHIEEVLEVANAQLGKMRPEYAIDICSFSLLENDGLNAERGCTQRVYHYLLPLKWLPGGNAVSKWWLDQHEKQDSQQQAREKSKRGRKTFGGVGTGEFRAKEPPPEPTLRLLKDTLRCAESREVFDGDAGINNKRMASGRFGTLGFRERRCWHNFAAPTLQGLASPSNEPVWKCLEKARIVEFFSHGEDQDVILVVEFRGEDFVEQSVRRIMGTAIAMTHGWLPGNFFELATQPDSLVETPSAPDGRLCFAGARFHFDELSRGASMFDGYEEVLSTKARNIRQRMLNRLQLELGSNEVGWLEELQNDICPRIMAAIIDDSESLYELESTPIRDSLAPPEYEQTLELLRDIISSGTWPETSVSRSKVIRQDTEENHNSTGMSGGSFTVVNPAFQDGILFDDSNSFAPPLANRLFPDLAMAVFALESKLAPDRPASSHCAVNCRAQFLPHVDSGRGAGQSTSLIAGLGDYNGGETVVESTSHDIRYKPLSFDGWQERHWTSAYIGERFSLVWFTPEMDILA